MKKKHPSRLVKKKTWKESLMSFTPLQLQALQMLFTMPPEERQKALAVCMTPPQPLRAPVVSLRPAGSCSSGDGDNLSVASNGDIRIHHKDKASELAKYLVKTWFSARNVWRHIYNHNNRIDNQKLTKILEQIKPELSKSERKVLKLEKEKVVKAIKKKMAAARRYRLQAKTEARQRSLEAPRANTIDLSWSADEDEENKDKTDVDDKKDREDGAGGGADKDDGAGSGNVSPACRKKILMDEAKKFTDKLKKNRDTRQRTRRSQRKTTSKNNEVKSKKKNSGRTRSASKRKAATKSATPAKKKPTPDAEDQNSNRQSPSRWKDRHINSKDGPSFDVGAKVMGCWQGPSCTGDWYEGVVVSIDDEKQTAHVVYNDGDFDKDLKWTNMTLLE